MKNAMKNKFTKITSMVAAITLMGFIAPAYAAETGLQIIRKLDKNRGYGTQKFSMKMTIQKGKRTQVKKIVGYGKERGNKSYMQFTNVEDKGVKYLKVKSELWIYLPEADDIMKISGHMLRRGLMGGDLSYEDMMQDEHFEKRYDVKLVGSEKIRGVNCYKVKLTAKVKDALYAEQILYIDKKRPVALKIDMYARGGRLMKTMEQFKIKVIQGRYVAMKSAIQDKRKKNSLTTLEIIAIKFNVKAPGRVFTSSYLKR